MQAGIPFYEIPARLFVFKEALPRRGNLVFLVFLVFPVPLYFLENQAPLTRPVRRRPRHRRRYRG